MGPQLLSFVISRQSRDPDSLAKPQSVSPIAKENHLNFNRRFSIICNGCLLGISPSTKTFSSKSFVWAPTHLFFLLKKYRSVVRIQHTSKAVCLLRHPRKKPAGADFFFLGA